MIRIVNFLAVSLAVDSIANYGRTRERELSPVIAESWAMTGLIVARAPKWAQPANSITTGRILND